MQGELVEPDLRHNKLGDEGAVTLITGLRRSSSTTLKIVRLSRNRITDRGGAAIAEYLADNQVCMSLRQLDLSVNALRDDTSIGGAIKANRRLSELDLSSNALRTGHVIASALGTNRSLTHANLLYNRLDIGSAVELAAVVRASRAHGVSLTLCGVPPVAECINLPRRNMSTSDAILLAAELETSHTVRSVDLSHNALGPEAASALGEALHATTTLTSLNLQSNRLAGAWTSFGDEVGRRDISGVSALAASLSHHNTLTRLNLSNNALGEDGARVIAEAVRMPRRPLTPCASCTWAAAARRFRCRSCGCRRRQMPSS